MSEMMGWIYFIKQKFRRWNYKRKYGINIEDGLKEYGRYIRIVEMVGDPKVSYREKE